MTSETPAGMSKSFVEDPGRVTELASAIASGSLSPVALIERYLDRIEKVDGDVQAWRLVDRDGGCSAFPVRYLATLDAAKANYWIMMRRAEPAAGERAASPPCWSTSIRFSPA